MDQSPHEIFDDIFKNIISESFTICDDWITHKFSDFL